MGVVGDILLSLTYVDDKITCFVVPKLLLVFLCVAYKEIQGAITVDLQDTFNKLFKFIFKILLLFYIFSLIPCTVTFS